MSNDEEITLEKTINVQDKLIQKYERQIRGLERKILDLEAEIGDLKGAGVLGSERVKKLTEMIQTQEKVIRDFEEQKLSLNKKIEAYLRQINEQELEVREKSDQLLAKEKEIGALEEKIRHLTDEIWTKSQENQDLMTDLQKLQDEKFELSNKAARLSGIMGEQKDRIISSDKMIETLQSKVFELGEITKEKDIEIERLKAVYQKNVAETSDFKEQVYKLREQLKTADKNNLDLKSQLEELRGTSQEIQQLQSLNEELKTKLEEKQALRVGTVQGREKILNYIRVQLEKTLSKISITTPNIMDLKRILDSFAKIAKPIQIRIATHINPEINQHIELLNQLKSMPGISIHNYTKEDRWCIERDGAEVLIAHGGMEPVGAILEDTEFISLVRSLITEPWIGSKVM